MSFIEALVMVAKVLKYFVVEDDGYFMKIKSKSGKQLFCKVSKNSQNIGHL